MTLPSFIIFSLFFLLLSGEDCIDRSLYCTPIECETRPIYAKELCRRTCKSCNRISYSEYSFNHSDISVTRADSIETVKYAKNNETKAKNGSEEASFITPPLFGYTIFSCMHQSMNNVREIASDSVQSSQSSSHSTDLNTHAVSSSSPSPLPNQRRNHRPQSTSLSVGKKEMSME